MKIKIKNAEKLTALLLSGTIALSTLAGCGKTYVVVPDATEKYDTIDGSNVAEAFKPQVLDVPGENFKLVIEYSLDEKTAAEWRITSDKKIYTKVYTQGLTEDTKVYIDNVHTDTTIVSSYASMNGITQDTMDNRIHNSLMLGFPISNTTPFYAVNSIEGQNDTFISGTTLGINGYTSGTVIEKRYTEDVYLKYGVYGNKIASVYGLLIQKGDEEPYGVDVSSDVVVLASNTITCEDITGKQKVYVYDRKGNKSEIQD